MNLTKLFNLKYFLQNIKKSQALIILLMIVVPMFTSIMLLTIDSKLVLEFPELGIINIIGMYIIPVVLSMTLFSYVYKKNSVDFMGSMPLSRKTIFLTNTIGGIVLIVIMQLATLISTLFLAKLISGVIIFSSMVWDIFVFFTVSYIFVFTISNLAMSFSGNKFSQIVSICLITFLVPFIVFSCQTHRKNIYNIDKTLIYESATTIAIEENTYYTAPSYIFGLTTGAEYEYNGTSILKMLMLSIVYIPLGLILFNRKKLEMAGESYENVLTHLIVKMLTFIPFMFVYCSLNDSDMSTVFLFFVAILAVYYFVFDLITNKKIKLKITIPAFILSGVLIFAVYECVLPRVPATRYKRIDVNEVQSVCIDSLKSWSRNAFGLQIEDENMINMILSQARIRNTYETKYIEEYEGAIDTTEVQQELYKGSDVKLIVTMKNGKTYETSVFLNGQIFKEIIQKYGAQKPNLDFNNSVAHVNRLDFTKENREQIVETINREYSELTFKEIYNIFNSESSEYILRLYEYRNHKLVRNDFSYKGFKELYRVMSNMCNNITKNVLYNVNSFNIYNVSREKLFEMINSDLYENIDHEKFIYEILYQISRDATSEIREFIKKDMNNEFDVNKEYIVIESNYPIFYYTNDVDGICKIIVEKYNEYYDELDLISSKDI